MLTVDRLINFLVDAQYSDTVSLFNLKREARTVIHRSSDKIPPNIIVDQSDNILPNMFVVQVITSRRLGAPRLALVGECL
jgi:hypothetical protein